MSEARTAGDGDKAASAVWKDIPVREDEPDVHPASDHCAMRAESGLYLVCARVRGRKHKHDGANCDDWFRAETSGPWTIAAVSDGAGSKRFSRVGARVATEAVVSHLVRELSTHRVRHRAAWSAAAFESDDLKRVPTAIEASLSAAWQSVKEAAALRRNSDAHIKCLGREITVSDLSATLLVAVHTCVQDGAIDKSLVFACSVGDGMIAVIDDAGRARPLMNPDIGEHSGETCFFDADSIGSNGLRRRIVPFFGQMTALMLMTDGVADDYFPSDPGMSLLYDELRLKSIIPSPLEADQLAASPSVLPSSGRETTGLMTEPDDPGEKLRRWLDTYYRRGSFDDRTLIVLHR